MEKLDELGKLDEEFNNFMLKVNEVESIVKKLASNDRRLQEIGNLEAKKYLGETSEKVIENIDSEEIILKIRNNRTLINKKRCEENDIEISQETFMDVVSKDAERRYKDKLVRTEKMETFKKQATLAFRRGEYEKALTLYNKAIEQIKDSCLLYNNRALTYMNLKLYEKSRDDLKWALRINENCLKSLLLLAKINFLENKMDEYDLTLKEALERNPHNEKFIKVEYKSESTRKLFQPTVFHLFLITPSFRSNDCSPTSIPHKYLRDMYDNIDFSMIDIVSLVGIFSDFYNFSSNYEWTDPLLDNP